MKALYRTASSCSSCTFELRDEPSFGHNLWLEPARQRLALTCEQTDVAADGDKPASDLEPVSRVGLDRGEDAGELAGVLNARDRGIDRSADVGVGVVPQMAHVGGEIARSDEQTVDAVHGRDRFQVLQGHTRFNLHDD